MLKNKCGALLVCNSKNSDDLVLTVTQYAASGLGGQWVRVPIRQDDHLSVGIG